MFGEMKGEWDNGRNMSVDSTPERPANQELAPTGYEELSDELKEAVAAVDYAVSAAQFRYEVNDQIELINNAFHEERRLGKLVCIQSDFSREYVYNVDESFTVGLTNIEPELLHDNTYTGTLVGFDAEVVDTDAYELVYVVQLPFGEDDAFDRRVTIPVDSGFLEFENCEMTTPTVEGAAEDVPSTEEFHESIELISALCEGELDEPLYRLLGMIETEEIDAKRLRQMNAVVYDLLKQPTMRNNHPAQHELESIFTKLLTQIPWYIIHGLEAIEKNGKPSYRKVAVIAQIDQVAVIDDYSDPDIIQQQLGLMVGDARNNESILPIQYIELIEEAKASQSRTMGSCDIYRDIFVADNPKLSTRKHNKFARLDKQTDGEV